jgi:hypothetical protein
MPNNDSSPIFAIPLVGADGTYFDRIKGIEEGWFAEFKVSCPDSQKIAKSVSSFANAYGGVLFIGVQEDAKTRRFDHFVPVTRDAADATITRIRQAIEAHLQPCPFFEIRAIEIPDADAESDERWIIAVRVPKGERPPYLHSSGVIYTRKGDSASPTVLNDLGLLDRLWGESKESRRAIGKLVGFLSEQTRSSVPRLELAIHAKSDGEDPALPITFERFRSIASTPVSPNSTAIFANSHTIGNSYIARYAGENPAAVAPSWEYDNRSGLHYISLPIASKWWRGGKFDPIATGQWTHEPLANHLLSAYPDSHHELLILDLSPTLFLLSAIMFKVFKLHEAGNKNLTLRANFRASSVRNTVPYIELPRFAKRLASEPTPFIHRNIQFACSLDSPEDWISLRVEEVAPMLGMNVELPNTIGLFVRIAQSLGIPGDVTLGAEDPEKMDSEHISALFGNLASSNFSFSLVENPNWK